VKKQKLTNAEEALHTITLGILMHVTVVLQWYDSGVIVVLQWCNSGVTVV
jgi:hypothetical protein